MSQILKYCLCGTTHKEIQQGAAVVGFTLTVGDDSETVKHVLKLLNKSNTYCTGSSKQENKCFFLSREIITVLKPDFSRVRPLKDPAAGKPPLNLTWEHSGIIPR